MPIVSPVGRSPQAAVTPTDLPRFSGRTVSFGSSSLQTGAEAPSSAAPQRTIPPKSKSCTETVISYVGFGIRKVIAGGLYLIPNAIKAPVAQKIAEGLNAWMSRFKHDPNAPETKIIANHELGHALVALCAGLPMEGLHFMNVRGSGGGVVFAPEVRESIRDTDSFYKVLISLMAGHAAELNSAPDEQQYDLKFISQSRMRALHDLAQAMPLVRKAQQQGWIQLKPYEAIPSDIDLDRYVGIIQKTRRTEEDLQLQRVYATRIKDFMNLSVVSQALQAARQIHAQVPTGKRAQLADAIAHCDLTLNRKDLYSLLNQHVNAEDLQHMQSRLQRFIPGT